jgi:nucleotide-binding universal stress UspA family protein
MTARAENSGQRRILVGVDGSVPSKAALSWAVEQGRLTGAVVQAVIAREFPVTYGYPLPVSDVDWEQLAQQAVSEAVPDVADGGAARVDRPALRASRHLPCRGDPRLGHRPPPERGAHR